MRYIRTELGIVDTEKYDRESYIFSKEADTIEELCDEFVEISPYNSLSHSYNTFKEAKMMNHCGYVFGMNWVFDKNNVPTLKAVAKINVTGELELL